MECTEIRRPVKDIAAGLLEQQRAPGPLSIDRSRLALSSVSSNLSDCRFRRERPLLMLNSTFYSPIYKLRLTTPGPRKSSYSAGRLHTNFLRLDADPNHFDEQASHSPCIRNVSIMERQRQKRGLIPCRKGASGVQPSCVLTW